MNVWMLFRSCLSDSCACPPSGRCYCESLLAYALQCDKEGITVNWKHHTKCNEGKQRHFAFLYSMEIYVAYINLKVYYMSLFAFRNELSF